MPDDSPPASDGRDWSRPMYAGSLLALAAGALVLLTGIATQGPLFLVFVLAGVVPLVLGSVGLAHRRWAPTADEDRGADPVEELKRRYAAGDVEDEELERKVEHLLAADGSPRSLSDRNGERREREPARR